MENKTFDMDFDLPDVADNTQAGKPRIHIAGDVCVSCEG